MVAPSTSTSFGSLIHEAVANATESRLRYVGSGNNYVDFEDRLYPQCRYELATDNPSTVADHVRRGVPPDHIVTYPALPDWLRFVP